MNPEQALKIVQQALDAANLKGVYSLADANQILIALNALNQLVIDSIPELGGSITAE
jgi:hypothetical protein